MSYSLTFWFVCASFLLLAPGGALCFGAGEVHPDIVGRAFLHGDLARAISHIQNLGDLAFKLTKDDIDAVYWGNWLRDYSQAMDTMALTKVGKDAILVVVQALSFMAFGFATREFRLTEEKLAVYSHAEHIDNPRGYESAQAQAVHPLLRGEVFEDELEVDLATGMKNYIAHEGQGYNTSARYVRNTLRECIARGRNANNMRTENHDKYAALRLLGAALHTLEDFLAHTNWCELVLRKLGHNDVFCYVGDDTWIGAPNVSSKVPPLVTGTFSGDDFTISVFGTVEDKLCAHGSTDLQSKIKAAQSVVNPMPALKMLLDASKWFSPKLQEFGKSLEGIAAEAEKLKGQIAIDSTSSTNPSPPSKPQSDDNETRRLAARAEFAHLEAGDKDRNYYILGEDRRPDNGMGLIWDLLNIRDDLMRELDEFLKQYPAMEATCKLIQKTANKVVWLIIAQLVEPSIEALTDVSNDTHRDLYYQAGQQEVFDKSESCNPTHSWLAKDHFNNALHVPAAKAAEVVVKHAVGKVLKAWNDPSFDAEAAIDEILETFHHPYFRKEGSKLQKDMEDSMVESVKDLVKDNLIEKLSKQNVKAKQNVRHVPQPKTTLDKLGDIFGGLAREGPGLISKLGQEIEQARQTLAAIGEEISRGEILEKARQLEREQQTVLQEAQRIAEEKKRKFDEEVARVSEEKRKQADEVARLAEEKRKQMEQALRDAAEKFRPRW